ncbi:DUF58 domain-containing protein [Leptolyngbya sp. AN02str]|uniref:DUF58 domain-containing protein n=1 Tax=Leptolyngbya sp. AN02str TaxID=3423363 RepID=UPI003D31E13A
MTRWLERRWVAPAYSGWLMLGLALFFFAAATNTMAGWLYVMSGVMLALLLLGAWLPVRSLRQVNVLRSPIEPVSVGDTVVVELTLHNASIRPKTLLQARDRLPPELGTNIVRSLDSIGAKQAENWVYYLPADRRGVYRWQTVELRTATPLGLFWCRRSHQAPAHAVIYPTVLPLGRCPLIDEIGRNSSLATQSNARAQGATEGVTRTLRPYRWGDPTRLIHWRTSARYGELRVRELEVFTGGQDVVICLDSASAWDPDAFESAVSAAASLYFYALRQGFTVNLWTASTGLVRGDRAVLEALAAVSNAEPPIAERLPEQPIVWLSQNANSLSQLPSGSRWMLWQQPWNQDEVSVSVSTPAPAMLPGTLIRPDLALQPQLQSALH